MDKIDHHALMIGNPTGSLSASAWAEKHRFYFVILESAVEASKEAVSEAVKEHRTASKVALRLGPLLGAGQSIK